MDRIADGIADGWKYRYVKRSADPIIEHANTFLPI